MDANHKFFLIDNVINRFSLHRMSDRSCIRTYDTKPAKTYPKQVEFGEDSAVVVGGSDNGLVYIFDKMSGILLQTLWHSEIG
ncbi:hypothetical protein ID866_9611 [Astraeus odoratus]|nr:hypothetical protein ID866_9611 [Astraeus odoratus]